jgi:hypothetical protein
MFTRNLFSAKILQGHIDEKTVSLITGVGKTGYPHSELNETLISYHILKSTPNGPDT